MNFLRNLVEGIVQEGFDWLRVLRRSSCLVLILLIFWFICPYAMSVIYHAKNRGDVEFRLLALEERCDHFRNEIFELKRQIKKLE